MSLVGSLEDLGLADILQIVSLSRKSGVLQLRSNLGDGRIILRSGTVFAASVKGEPEDLRGILMAGRVIEEAGFDEAVNRSRRTGMSLEEALCENPEISPERIEALRREHVERAVLQMFGWSAGEFSFEVGGEIDDRDAELLLSNGVNAEFLAIEVTRIHDEDSATEPDEFAASSSATGDSDTGDVTFSGEVSEWVPDFGPEETPEPLDDHLEMSDSSGRYDAKEAMGLWVANKVGADLELALEPSHGCRVDRGPLETPSPVRMVAIDPDLAALEWLKAALAGVFSRIHIFQSSENGVARIRQYLGRGEIPVVMIAATLSPEMGHGAGDVASLLERLHKLAPRMPILIIAEDDAPGCEAAALKSASDVAKRPPSRLLADRSLWSTLEPSGSVLRAQLLPWIESVGTASTQISAGRRAVSEPAGDALLTRLVHFSARLRDSSTGAEVLSIVLQYAGESLPRAAIFTVRDEMLVGLAQRGLAESGGPDDDELSELRMPLDEVEWFRRALEERRPLRGRPSAGKSCPWLAVLGPAQPVEVFVAPIVSGAGVAAILYADAVSGDPPIGDTSAVEVVLNQAGLALERALLKHALPRD